MSDISTTSPRQDDAYWWQGGLYRMKARAGSTGGKVGLVEASLYRNFGPPLHIHHREDEAIYVIDGDVRFRQGDADFVGGPGTWVWGPRGLPHAFKVESESARILVLVTPAGFERMFEVGGVPLSASAEPPVQEYDPAAAEAISNEFGFEVVGPQL